MEDYKKWELDWVNTLTANMVRIFFAFLILIYIIFTISFIGNIDNDNTKIIALIVYMFSVVKLLSWIGYPTLEYKLRKKK